MFAVFLTNVSRETLGEILTKQQNHARFRLAKWRCYSETLSINKATNSAV